VGEWETVKASELEMVFEQLQKEGSGRTRQLLRRQVLE
jgi:hypothetical protein